MTNADASARGLWGLVKAVAERASRHHSLLLASGVAFTSALALVPALISVVALYGLVASPADVEANLGGLTDVLPDAAAELIITELQALATTDQTRVTIGLMIGLAGSAWAISSVVNSMVIAIRVAHEQPSPHNWVQGRIFALRLSVVAVVASAVSIWLIVAIPAAEDRFGFPGPLAAAGALARWPIVVFVSVAALALLYRVVAGQRGRVLGVSAGTAFAAGVWMLSTYGLSLAYQHIGRLQSTFTTLGAVAALLIWFYFSAVAVVLGAELDGELTQQVPPLQ